MHAGNDTRLWTASLEQPVETEAFEGTHSVDLAVIGGGFTGCAAALEAARAGADVAVLEAHSFGFGGSGRNVGLVNAGLWLPPETILAQMGDQRGRRLIDALSTAPDLVFRTIDEEDIACEATRNGTLHLAHAPAGVKDLQNRQRQGNAFGAALELLDASETRARVGSDAFHGALLNPRAGTVQPLAYCHGLARAAQRAGAQLFANSPVTGCRHDGKAWVLQTGQGVLRARCLLRATNAYGLGAGAAQRAQSMTVFYCQFATAPLTSDQRAAVLPGLEGCWDTALVMSSFRLDAAGRLILGGMGNAAGPGARLHADWARRKLRATFPMLGDVPFEYEWTGRIAMTGDHVPKVQRIGPDGLSVFGYSGRGIAPGTVFGFAAAKALLSADPDLIPLPIVETYAEPFAGLRSAAYETGATLVHAMSARGQNKT